MRRGTAAIGLVTPPGGAFPDYELPDNENVPGKLSAIQGGDPLILTLARGDNDPARDWTISRSGTEPIHWNGQHFQSQITVTS